MVDLVCGGVAEHSAEDAGDGADIFEMDMALSLRMIMKRLRSLWTLFNASSDIPQVSVASPMMGMTCSCRFVRSRFFATPRASDKAVPACACKEMVVRGLFRVAEAAQAIVFSDAVEIFISARQNLWV